MLQADDVARVATGKGVTVAVVDSGIDVTNEHLRNAVIGGVNLVGDGERADGMSDLFGHGTAIAGVISGERVAGSEMVGLARDAKLLSVRVYRGDDAESIKAGFGPDDVLMAEGIRWAVDHGATIINVSMSAEDDAIELQNAVDYATSHDVLVVASAGNRNTSTEKADSPRYPAADPGALSVTAVNTNGDVTEASIHGSHIDVAAPGQSVLTVQAGGGDCVFAADHESTSYATAYTSAAAALVAQAHPDESPAQWSYRLMATAIRFNPEARNDLAGWGIIQPLDAITLVPGSGERGPISPFTAGAPMTVALAGTVVSPLHSTSPFVTTKEAATGVGLVAAAALGTLGVLAVYRRRPTLEQAADAGPKRAGLLDAARSDLTRLR
jgi:subtilisin family serine protease